MRANLCHVAVYSAAESTIAIASHCRCKSSGYQEKDGDEIRQHVGNQETVTSNEREVVKWEYMMVYSM